MSDWLIAILFICVNVFAFGFAFGAGYESYRQSPEYREKQKQKLLRRYGSK